MEGVARQRAGKWFVDSGYPLDDEPIMVTISWPVLRAYGDPRNYGSAPELIDGLVVTHVRDSDRFQAYAHGSYLILDTAKDGSVTKTPIPQPKVRAGLTVAFRAGQWRKLLKTGWVPA